MSYEGIFVREDLGQQPGKITATSNSPDIILAGEKLAEAPSQYTTADSYATRSRSDVYLQKNNYVYLRGLNTNTSGQASNMFFYYTESNLLLWPKNWRSDHITVASNPQNWSPLETSGPNVVGVTTQPLVWVPPALTQNDHYCVIAWADNSGGAAVPPDFGSMAKFSSNEQLVAFLQAHPNMGWRNTNDIYGTPPQYSFNAPVQLAAKGGTINLSISFIDIPADGTFNVMLQGTDSSNSIALQGLKISDYQGGFNVNGLSYPSNFNTSLQVEWFKGPTNPPITAQVIVFLTIDSSPLLFDECNKLGIITDNIAVELIQANFALPHQKDMVFKPTPVVRAGQQTWSLLYGVNPPSGKKGGLVHG